jgi:hypothetical protein
MAPYLTAVSHQLSANPVCKFFWSGSTDSFSIEGDQTNRRKKERSVDLDTFIVAIYCLIDDLMRQTLAGRPLRQPAPAPTLEDREVITMEVVGEFLGLDTDNAIFLFFGRHYA